MSTAGTMNRFIVIEYVIETTEPVYRTKLQTWLPLDVKPGSPTEEQPIACEWQDFLPSRSARAESVVSGLAIARNQSRCRIRWRDDVTSKMRIKLLGDTNLYFQIVVGPAEIEGRKRRLEMVCERFSS